MKLNLKRITAVCLQGRPNDNSWYYIEIRNRIKKSLTYMVNFFDFYEVIVISPENPEIEGVTYIHTDGISYYEYNKWCLHNLSDYVTTDFCLLFQDDGFPLNPDMWRDEFYDYDYVGAPIRTDSGLQYNEEQIGGGGFTLRSKKLLEYTKTIPFPKEGEMSHPNEDTMIVFTYRDDIVARGLKICPHNIARNFVIQTALDENHTLYNTFGYHGRDEKLKEVDVIMKQRMLNI